MCQTSLVPPLGGGRTPTWGEQSRFSVALRSEFRLCLIGTPQLHLMLMRVTLVYVGCVRVACALTLVHVRLALSLVMVKLVWTKVAHVPIRSRTIIAILGT